MVNKFSELDTTLNLQEIFYTRLKPSINKLSRNCPSLSDENFINAGMCRIISESKSGRDFLQKSDELFNTPIPKTTFFDTLHSSRRLELINQISSINYESINQELSNNGIDNLREFNDIDGYDVFSIDGHYIEHACHTEQNEKGKVYASGNLYALNMRTNLIQQFACVTDGTVKSHEMPIFRERMAIENAYHNIKKKTIYINDRAFIDHRWWLSQKKKNNFLISRTKKNKSIQYCGDLDYDKTDPVNAGVISDRLGGFANGGALMRIIEYIDPESGEQMTFYSTLGKEVRPGVICWLYFLRWQIEKVFDCFKNELGEIKSWATGKKATGIQGHFICMFYNFIQLLSENTKNLESCEDEKAKKKYVKNLEVREAKAKELGRYIHPLIYTCRKISRMSCQFIRSVRNYFYSKKPLTLILPKFAERLKRYL